MTKEKYPFDHLPQLALQQQQVMTEVKALESEDKHFLKHVLPEDRPFLYAILQHYKMEVKETENSFSQEDKMASEIWKPVVALLAEEFPFESLVASHEQKLQGKEAWESWALYLIERLQHTQTVLEQECLGGCNVDDGVEPDPAVEPARPPAPADSQQ